MCSLSEPNTEQSNVQSTGKAIARLPTFDDRLASYEIFQLFCCSSLKLEDFRNEKEKKKKKSVRQKWS